MDPLTFMPNQHAQLDPLEHDLIEIDAAITLVTTGVAMRVRLVGLARPEAVAATGLARAQAAEVGFSLDRGPSGVVAVTLGPRL